MLLLVELCSRPPQGWVSAALLLLMLGPESLAVSVANSHEGRTSSEAVDPQVLPPQRSSAWSDKKRHRATRAERLVAQLNSDLPQARREAELRLQRLGSPAIPALTAGLEHPQAEVRERCLRALGRVQEAEYYRRLIQFQDDTTGERGVSLPGWDFYQRIVGATPADREFFVAMHRAEPALMAALDAEPGRLQTLIDARTLSLQSVRQYGLPEQESRPDLLPALGAMYLAAATPTIQLQETSEALLLGFTYRSEVHRALKEKSRAGPLVDLLQAWVARESGSKLLIQRFVLALRYDLQRVLPTAVATIKQGESDPRVIMYALLCVGKFGSAGHLPLLESRFQDETVCTQTQRGGQLVGVQLREIALAMAAEVLEERLSDYGFSAQASPLVFYNATSLAFANDQARQAAFDKWRMRHPRKASLEFPKGQ